MESLVAEDSLNYTRNHFKYYPYYYDEKVEIAMYCVTCRIVVEDTDWRDNCTKLMEWLRALKSYDGIIEVVILLLLQGTRPIEAFWPNVHS